MDKPSPESDISQFYEEPNAAKDGSSGHPKIAETDQQARKSLNLRSNLPNRNADYLRSL